MHEFTDQSIIVSQHQRTQRHDSFELALTVHNIHGIDSLRIQTYLFDMSEGLFCGKRFFDVDIIDRHETPSAVFRIIQKSIDQLAFFLRSIEENFIHQIGRKLFQKVDDIIDFVLCNAVDDLYLLVFADIGENLYRDIFWEKTEGQNRLVQTQFFIYIFQSLRDIYYVGLSQTVPHCGIALMFQQIDNLVRNGIDIHVVYIIVYHFFFVLFIAHTVRLLFTLFLQISASFQPGGRVLCEASNENHALKLYRTNIEHCNSAV